ncbi:hypothetical protein [Metapseudomonas otitidis]|uniref:hypothetical protein n=1 Tax=Metapseudomonas otitidis TaxID=319939 RepID=UPI00280BD36F|nr:hypothetical protein [Pseudomonas otitidis]
MTFTLKSVVKYQPDLTQPVSFVKVIEVCPPSERKGRRYKIQLPDGSLKTVAESALSPTGSGLTYGTPPTLQDVPDYRRRTNFALLYLPDDLIFTGDRLYYRGDSRLPDAIFRTGFQPRELHAAPLLAINTGDIATDSAVTFSSKPEIAGMFPLLNAENREAITYLYLFNASEIFDTNRLQSHLSNNPKNTTDKEHLVDMLAADEKAVAHKGISGEQILCAWQIYRHWSGDTWQEGCNYTIMRMERNPAWNPSSSSHYADWQRSESRTIFTILHTELIAKMRGHSPTFK